VRIIVYVFKEGLVTKSQGRDYTKKYRYHRNYRFHDSSFYVFFWCNCWRLYIGRYRGIRGYTFNHGDSDINYWFSYEKQ